MDTRNFKDSTKAAAAYLAEQGIDVPHTRLLEALSRAFGERNWSTLSAQLQALKAPTAPAPAEAIPEWDISQGPMTEAQYVAKKGVCCPFCGSRSLEATSIQADGPDAWDDTKCGDCNATWSSAYSLTGYFDEKVGVPVVKQPAIILVWPGTFTANKEGFLFKLSSVRPVLTKYLELAPDCSDVELVIAIDDEPGCIMELREHGVSHLSRAVRGAEWEIRTQLTMEAQDMKLELYVGRADVIDDLVEDVKTRARKHGFTSHGWARALECVSESNDVLNLDATPAEKFAAASHLA